MKKEIENRKVIDDGPPPIFKTWRSWYLLVILNLLFLIIIFYLFTIAYK